MMIKSRIAPLASLGVPVSALDRYLVFNMSDLLRAVFSDPAPDLVRGGIPMWDYPGGRGRKAMNV